MENTIGSPASIIFDKVDANNAVVNITAPTKKEIAIVLKCLQENFTYVNPNKKHSWEYTKGYIKDCNESSFDRKTQTLQIGLIPKAAKYIRDAKIDIKIGVSERIRSIYSNADGNIDEEQIKKYAENLNIYNSEKNIKIVPYEHQIKICKEIINGRRISILACTSSGKSLSIYIIVRYLLEHENKKILVITPSKGLVVQLFDNFEKEYGWIEAKKYCTLIYGESKDKLTDDQKEKLKDLNLGEETMLKNVTISTWQSLQKQPKEFFKCFSAVLVDEAHSTRGEVLRDILDKCINAINFKVGLSGTLPDDGLDSAWIEGSLGRKVDIIKMWELIEKGILPPMKIFGIKVPYDIKIRPFVCRQKYQEEYFLVTNNGSRKVVLDLLLESQITTEQNALILYKNKTTLDEMYEYLKTKHPEYTYHVIKGETITSIREDIKKILESKVGNIILGTFGTMKQGVNITLLHNLIFAEFSKSMYEIVQALGRVARYHKDKKESRVFDIYDDCSYMTKPREGNIEHLEKNYSYSHYEVRNRHYANEKIPIIEYSLDNIYTATITTDNLEKKKELARAKIANKKAKKTKKNRIASINKKQLGKNSQFFLN